MKKKERRFASDISKRLRTQRELIGDSIHEKFSSKFSKSDREWLEAFDLAELGGATEKLSKKTKLPVEIKREFFKEAKRRENDAMLKLRNFDTDELALDENNGGSCSAFKLEEDVFGTTNAVLLSDKREEHLASRGVRGGLKKKLNIIENDSEKLNELIQNDEEVREYEERGYRFMYDNKLYGYLLSPGLNESGLHEAVLFKRWMKKNNLEMHPKHQLEGVVS